MRSLTAVAAALLVLVAGCAGDDRPGESDRASDALSSADLETYFDAVASYDPDQLAAAEEIAADDSPAQGYALYLGEYAASAIAAGQPVDGAEAEEVEEGYEACGGTGAADECVTWADFEAEGGELADFTVAGIPLDESLVDLTAQAPIESPGLYTVQPRHAYRSPQSGTLFVLVTITAGDVALSPEPGIYIEPEVSLQGVPTRAPATIEPGESTPVILAFPDARSAALDGSVTFGLWVDGTPESIGFELTAP